MKSFNKKIASCFVVLLALNIYGYVSLFDLIKNPDDVISSARIKFLHQALAKEKLRRYRYVLNQAETRDHGKNPYPNKVWTLWTDGFDKAPQIVKICKESMERHIKDHEIIFLDMKNLHNYLKIPDYILEKYKKGIISHPHFADVVRIMLLSQYGGLWLDSSTFFTGKIPDQIWKSELCAPHYPELDKYVSKNFTFNDLVFQKIFEIDFIWVKKPHNYILDCLARFLKEYWKEHNSCDYMFLINFISIGIEEDPKFEEIVQNMLREHIFGVTQHDALDRKIKKNNIFIRSEWEKLRKFPIHKIHQIAKNGKKKYRSWTYGYKLCNGELS